MSYSTANVTGYPIGCRILHHKPAVVRAMMKGDQSWFQTFAVFCMLYVFFCVIPRRLNFICRRFGTLCLFHLQSVPKRRHIKFRRRRITQKKTYNKGHYVTWISFLCLGWSNERGTPAAPSDAASDVSCTCRDGREFGNDFSEPYEHTQQHLYRLEC